MCSYTLPSAEELAGMMPEHAEAVLRQVDRLRRQAEVLVATWVNRVEGDGVHRVDGHRRITGWGRAAANWSAGEAQGLARLGRLLALWPLLAQAAEAGLVGVGQLRVLQQLSANPRVADHLPAGEVVLVSAAVNLDFDDFVEVVARWESLADPDGAALSDDAAHARRRARVVNVGTAWYVDAVGGAAQGLAIKDVFDAFCHSEWLADWEAGVADHGEGMCADKMARSDAQRRFDALHAMCLAAAASSTTTFDRCGPGVTVNVVIGEDRFRHELEAMLGGEPQPLDPNDPHHVCVTADGDHVDGRDVVIAAMHGHVRRVVINSAGVVVDVGRRQRFFTGALRDAVLLQHRRCIWPGCDRPTSRCQADHLQPWAHAGPTSTSNGAPNCDHHNRWRTRGYTTVRDEHGRWHHYRPNGTEIGWRSTTT